jgi:hypothetical protein
MAAQRFFGAREILERGQHVIRPSRDHRRIEARNAGRILHLHGASDFVMGRGRRVIIHAREAIHLDIHPSGGYPSIHSRGRRAHGRNRFLERNFYSRAGACIDT